MSIERLRELNQLVFHPIASKEHQTRQEIEDLLTQFEGERDRNIKALEGQVKCMENLEDEIEHYEKERQELVGLVEEWYNIKTSKDQNRVYLRTGHWLDKHD